jgi:hypothetical protein
MIMKKVITWLKESNRYKHLIGGMAIGFISDDWYCAGLSGVGIASALEYKDKTYGGLWDWADWALTVAGVAAGHLARRLFFN